jgi:tetratricopeptide (TPR) repeat protein
LERHFVITLYTPKIFLFLTLASFLIVIFQTNTWGLESPQRNENHGIKTNKDILMGIDLLYNEQFDDAEKLFQNVILKSPSKPIGYFYLAMVTWSRLASGFWSRETVGEYKERIDRAIQVAKSHIDKNIADSYEFFYLGGALGYKGRFEMMKENWLSSFFLARSAIDAFRTCLKMDPNNKDVLLGFGTFDYYTAHLSGLLKFLTYLLVHKGDKEEGLRKLHLAAENAVYAATEAKSMLIHIYLFLEEDLVKALKLTDDLAEKYRQSPRYRVLLGVCYIRLGMDREYHSTVNLLRQRSLQASILSEAGLWGRRALYLETVYNLYHRQYRDARAKLEVILKGPDPLNDPAMIAWPLLKIGMSYDLEGNREEAIKHYHSVLGMENGSGAQFLAKKLLEDPPKKNDPFIG